MEKLGFSTQWQKLASPGLDSKFELSWTFKLDLDSTKLNQHAMWSFSLKVAVCLRRQSINQSEALILVEQNIPECNVDSTIKTIDNTCALTDCSVWAARLVKSWLCSW